MRAYIPTYIHTFIHIYIDGETEWGLLSSKSQLRF